jgi:crotonobetainyl-CoA:carnitine CoA-transferase CaiB-like acyl-CoA transferase
VVNGPLREMRVVDFTRFVSGSYATMVLAMLGADVIKVEPPEGDPYRHQGTVFDGGESVLFRSLNTGKRSVVVDFKSDSGRDVMDRLLANADFFVENSRPGSLEAYGLGFESVHERHPRVIYGTISGYGEVGPEATRGGFDLILQAETGLMSVTGSSASGPVKVGAPVLDIGAGLSLVIGLLAAHAERTTTGRGRLVSTSLLEFGLAGLSSVIADYLVDGSVPGRLGTHSPSFAPYGSFRTADGWLVLAGAGSEAMWQRACAVLGREELVSDPRFSDNAARVAHRDELTAEFEATLGARTTAEWLEAMAAAGVPASRVSDVGEAAASEQVAALGAIREVPSSRQPYRVVDCPVRFDHLHFEGLAPSPALGADTAAVMHELDFDDDAIGRLCAQGVVQCA